MNRIFEKGYRIRKHEMSVFGLPGRRNQMEQFRIGALGVEAGIAITPKSRTRFFRARLFGILHPEKVSPAG